MVILIDNGHRETTPGKRSPDGRLREWKWNKACADRLEQMLNAAGVKTWRVPQTEGQGEVIDLKNRIKAANAYSATLGEACMLVSIHCNAAGIGKLWLSARGWSIFIAPNASETSKVLAESIFSQARATGFNTRQQHANVGYWTQSLAMCRDTRMPAVLVENFFMDNRDDCQYLMSKRSIEECAGVICRGIMDCIR